MASGKRKVPINEEFEYDSSSHLARSRKSVQQVGDNCMVLQSEDFLPHNHSTVNVELNATKLEEADDEYDPGVAVNQEKDVPFMPHVVMRNSDENARCDVIRMDPRGDPLISSTSVLKTGTLMSKTNTLRPYATDTLSHTLTMTGTIKRGASRNDTQVTHVQLELSEAEVKKLNKLHEEEEPVKESCCSIRSGPHIFLLSLLCFPVALIVSTSFAFYVGTMFWYNVHILLTEEKTILHKIFLSPLWIIFYPVTVGFSSLAVGIYAACIQLSWYFSRWYREFCNFEKGFYGWLSNACHIPQCSPYEIVVLDEEQIAQDGTFGVSAAGNNTHSSSVGRKAASHSHYAADSEI